MLTSLETDSGDGLKSLIDSGPPTSSNRGGSCDRNTSSSARSGDGGRGGSWKFGILGFFPIPIPNPSPTNSFLTISIASSIKSSSTRSPLATDPAISNPTSSPDRTRRLDRVVRSGTKTSCEAKQFMN